MFVPVFLFGLLSVVLVHPFNYHLPEIRLLRRTQLSMRTFNNAPKQSYALSRNYYEKFMQQKQAFMEPQIDPQPSRIHSSKPTNFNTHNSRKYHPSQRYYEQYLRRLNSHNKTEQMETIMGKEEFEHKNDEKELFTEADMLNGNQTGPGLFIIGGLGGNGSIWEIHINSGFGETQQQQDEDRDEDEDEDRENKKGFPHTRNGAFPFFPQAFKSTAESKSKNFEVLKGYHLGFKDIGGYENVKQELMQCVDILTNYTKYARFNVRIPRGLILEGPPGNGKTLLAKGLAGESGCSFIALSGADFQEKYVGVGSSRIKELFTLANKHVPCIIFIDEIDAVGRKRSGDGESSSSERDNTLNALLVELDGFKNNTGVFLMGATNRVDLLDSALTRPGRMDKKIYIGTPDAKTREAILAIHLQGKPYNQSEITVDRMVNDMYGFSGAQIENVLNEAMLHALRRGREIFSSEDLEMTMNRVLAGWQPNDHAFTEDIIDHIAVHEMGHAIVGLMTKNHAKMKKVIINLSSPQMPGYTVFEGSASNIHIREALFEHLMILLAGRIAEETFYGESVSTGALNDFEEVLKLAQKMVMYYGMGTRVIYPSTSEKSKEQIDNEMAVLIDAAYDYAAEIISVSRELIWETAMTLKETKVLTAEQIMHIIETKYSWLLDVKYTAP